MKNVRDLHIQKEIIPLFDFTCNDYSRDVLVQLFETAPADLNDILFRQDILKGLIRNEQLFRPFSYARSEFNEVYTYSKDIPPISGFLFRGKKKQREKGQLTQLFIFFHKLDQFYFSHLITDKWPPEFAARISNLSRFLAELDVKKYAAIARNRSFSIVELPRLTRTLAEKSRTGELNTFWQDLFQFEAFLSLAKGIVKHHFVFPSFTSSPSHSTFPSFSKGGLSIKNFYHPLLKRPVRNSIDTRENVTLITGPNMSGKSTLLKAIGLCVHLAHLGLAVPAEKCDLPFFDVISVAIDLNDDLLSGYSHFMSEIKNLKHIVVEARQSRKCFAIFDELFRGTNAEDALAISKTTIEGLAQFHDSCFFISTHLHQLMETLALNHNIGAHHSIGAHDSIGAYCIECTLENETPVFTYRLLTGWSDLKIGQLIFEQEGLNGLLAKTKTLI
jgi:DNA mismatch repair protein MutS